MERATSTKKERVREERFMLSDVFDCYSQVILRTIGIEVVKNLDETETT